MLVLSQAALAVLHGLLLLLPLAALAVLHGLLLLLPLAALPVLDGLVVKRPRRPLAALAILMYQLMSGLVVMLRLVIATGDRVKREMRCFGVHDDLLS